MGEGVGLRGRCRGRGCEVDLGVRVGGRSSSGAVRRLVGVRRCAYGIHKDLMWL